MIRVLGMDPGTKFTGWAVIEQNSNDFYYIDSGFIDLQKIRDTSEKLHTLYEQTLALCEQYKPQCTFVENTFSKKNFLASLALARAQSSILIGCSKVNPTLIQNKQVKKIITGNGNIDKENLAFHIKSLLVDNLTAPSPDEIDAIAIAIAGCIMTTTNNFCSKQLGVVV
jgi:crossover junction endodeoxyribonuclease RuvC